jgi:hypothetical protein
MSFTPASELINYEAKKKLVEGYELNKAED